MRAMVITRTSATNSPTLPPLGRERPAFDGVRSIRGRSRRHVLVADAVLDQGATPRHRHIRFPVGGYLLHCPGTGARPGFGLGARAVAITAAAHAGRVALIWRARVGRGGRAGRGSLGVAVLEVAVPSRLDNQLERALEGSLSSTEEPVVIGMDPHKRSATIEVMTGEETIVGGGRFGTDRDGYAAMSRFAQQWPDRVWAIEGCQGIGRHVAVRLVRDGERVVDVPPKLSARARVFATGQGRKTDATDAHSVALVGTRMSGLRPVVNDEQLALLRILVDRRRSLGEDHTRMISQLHRLLLELIRGGGRSICRPLRQRRCWPRSALARLQARHAGGWPRN